jgi:hypothetical protein
MDVTMAGTILLREPTQEILQQPSGDCSQPSLSGETGRRITSAWRVLNNGLQRICIASILEPTQRRLLVVSPATQRFAATPAHVTHGNWSAVTWIDAAADGGDGHLYLSEINWPTH